MKLTTWNLVGDFEGGHFMAPAEDGETGEYVMVEDLPAALTWTTDKPTQPGVYWVDGYVIGADAVIIEIRRNAPGLPAGLYAWLPGLDDGEYVSEIDGCKWSGPLTPPSAP